MKAKRLLTDMPTCFLQSRQKWQISSILNGLEVRKRKEKTKYVSKGFGQARALEK